MTGDAGGEGARYWAFISYSHKDASYGRRLHRRLERYALPRRLVGRATTQGLAPRRLVPIFRDREELPAANDLSAEVRAALQASRSLVVVCSPDAAASEWVSREVVLFRSLHPDRPVLAAIREGEPDQCMPVALRRIGAGGDIVEPLAADFRRGRDGDHLGLLKLVAGIAGIGLDELLQRDSTRHLRRVMAVTVVALMAVLVMGTLTAFALRAEAEAKRQRGEAEGLVEFMLTDLRDRLKGVGRLDLMTAVNERALRYYGDQDINSLPAPSLERRARILHAMGEDDETRGNNGAALAKFHEAERTTAALLAASPNDPERIFAQAQTKFWIGSVYFQQNQFAAAAPFIRAYKHLIDRLIAIAPGNGEYWREAAEADEDLCAIALEKPVDLAAAVRYCSSSLAKLEKAQRHLGPVSAITDDFVDVHAWLGDAYLYAGDLERAKSERLKEEQILDRQIAADPKNMDLKDTWVILQRALAVIEGRSGDKAAARVRLDRALATIDDMIRFDPKNQSWSKERESIERNLSAFH